MKRLEDFYEDCYCHKPLTEPINDPTNVSSLVYECNDCGYTYSIHFSQLLGY